ncbi:hypothetical protein CCACVL1_01824, partial [Corchorus capsularis]
LQWCGARRVMTGLLTSTSPIVVAATGAPIGVIGSPVVLESKRTKLRNVSRMFSFVSL